jgi:NitT/TauT family transport system substrate-binding protein
VFRRVLYALILVTLVSGATGGAGAGTEGTVRIGTVKAPPAVPVLIAQEQGFFARQGVQMEVVVFPTATAVRQALLDGSVDAAILSVGATLQAFEQGNRFRNLVLLQGRPNATILTHKALNIRRRDFGALVGKRIGVDARSGRTELLLRALLLHARIPEGKVTIVPTGEFPEYLEAIRARRVDAQVTWEPGTSQLTLHSQLDVADVFLDMRASDAPYPVSRMIEGSVVALDAWVRSHRDTGLRIAKAVSCAERAMRTNPALIARIYEQNFPGLGQDVYANIAKFQPAVYWPRITRENIEVMSQVYRKLGLTKGTVRFEDVVPDGFPLAWWGECR